VQALVLCPTRELADQVTQEIRRLARAEDNIKVLSLVGGVPMRPAMASLEHGAHIVVGTPGRIMDHLQRGSLKLDGLNTLVLDEADRMLDMGFYDDIAEIARQCPKKRQTLLFSATYPEGIASWPPVHAPPKEVKLPRRHAATRSPALLRGRPGRTLDAVAKLLNHYRPAARWPSATPASSAATCSKCCAPRASALALHGELEQRERDQVLIQFANRSCSVLVATDVAARGLDIANLEAVINVDVTPDPEIYIHRIGRTGRADENGWALSLASPNQMARVDEIAGNLGTPVEWHPSSELTPRAAKPLLPPMATLQILAAARKRSAPAMSRRAHRRSRLQRRSGRQDPRPRPPAMWPWPARSPTRPQRRLADGKIKGKSVKVRILDIPGDVAEEPHPGPTPACSSPTPDGAVGAQPLPGRKPRPNQIPETP
jgi:ATP-dependent RNA helicase DbpA